MSNTATTVIVVTAIAGVIFAYLTYEEQKKKKGCGCGCDGAGCGQQNNSYEFVPFNENQPPVNIIPGGGGRVPSMIRSPRFSRQ